MLDAAKLAPLAEAMHALSALPPNQTVTEWCEANLELTSLQSDTPGRYSTRLTPYVREVLEDFKNPDVEEEILCFGAQTAKTQTFAAGVAWSLLNNPRPAIWVMPNKELAQAFSETRLQPFLLSCHALADRRHPDRHRWKKMQMEFTGAVLTLIGSNSPANLASRPAGLLVMDETDKFAEQSSKEANALELAEMRTRTFASPKIFKSSTPSIAEAAIWQALLRGDIRRFFLPCPHCGESMVLTLNPEKSALPRLGCEAKLEWDKRAKVKGEWDLDVVERTAHFVCPRCKQAVEEKHKTAMLRAGEWRPTNPNADSRVVSRHLPTFYAPWRKASWGRLAREFLQGQKSLDGLRGFITGTLAEPDMLQFEGGVHERRERIIADIRENPLAKPIRILTSDKQKDHLWFVCREWIRGGDSRLVEWGKIDDEDALGEVRARLNVTADLTGLDSGFEGKAVFRECARRGWFALRGDDPEDWVTVVNKQRLQLPYKVRIFDPYLGTSDQGRTKVAELTWSNPTFKDYLARLRDGSKSPVRWEIPAEYATEEYFRHLDAEYKAREFSPRTGKVYYLWKMRSKHWPNHLLDCELMNLAVAAKVGLLKLTNQPTPSNKE